VRNDGRRPIWHEPRPGDAPPRRQSDWLLVGAFELAAVVEAIFRPEVALRPLVTLIALAAAPALLWRRSQPLAAALVGFGAAMVLSVLQLVTDGGDLGLYSMMFVVILLYSLVRWGSGREVVIGLGFISVSVALGMYVSFVGWTDIFGGSVFLLMFVALAAAFRYRADVWHRQLAEIRNQERVGLARELHDTVAHHVSAIAVQAQAGRAVAGTRPEAAVATLAAIESEATRTLAEMRAMVRVLRDGEATEYAPQPGIADLSALARNDVTPVVQVTVSGELGGLPEGIDAALYRLARESLTNALRHARHASRVLIEVAGEPDVVRLRVADDGEMDPAYVATPGFGLIGMAERAQLLGGTLSAGPAPGGGWTVSAALPRQVPA
jgi:signal transduction histidine kinase